MKTCNVIKLAVLIAMATLVDQLPAVTLTVYNLTANPIGFTLSGKRCMKNKLYPSSPVASMGHTGITAVATDTNNCGTQGNAIFNFWLYSQQGNESQIIGQFGINNTNPDSYISSDYSNEYTLSEKRYNNSGSSNDHYYSLQYNKVITFNLYSDMSNTIYANFTPTTSSTVSAIINTATGNAEYGNTSACVAISPKTYYIIYDEANAEGENSNILTFYQDSACTTPVNFAGSDLSFSITANEIYNYDNSSSGTLNNASMEVISPFINLFSSQCGSNGSTLNNEYCTLTLNDDITP